MASKSLSIENDVVFQSLKELMLMVHKFTMEINFETHTVKSKASRYIVKCKDEHFTWRLDANPIGGGFWKIKEFQELYHPRTNNYKSVLLLSLCYHVLVKGFANCKPLLGVDGTHMRSRYQGILLTATVTDTEGQLFPLTFIVVRYRR